MTRPPGALLLAAALGAGLLTGLSRFGDPVILLPIALATAWSVRLQWWWPAPLAFALGIVLGGQARADARRSCAARLPLGEQQLQLELIDPGSGSGRVTLPRHDCRGEVMARWPHGMTAPAGSRLDVLARWYPRTGLFGKADGILIVRNAHFPAGERRVRFTLIERFRTYLAEASTRLYGNRAPFVDALVTGRRGELDPTLRAAFTASGLVHLLAISGFHIGLLAAWILMALRMAGMSRHRAEALATLVAMGYALFLGWPPPAARSALLLAGFTWSRWRQRNPRPAALLGISVLPLLLFSPWSILDVGAWLSVVALAGLTVATRWSDQAISDAPMTRAVSASVGASVATAPFTALVFGQVAPIAILLGLFAGPIATLVQPAIMASLLLEQAAPSMAAALAASSGLLLGIFESIVRLGASAPGAATAGEPGVAAAWPWIAVLAAACWATHSRSTVAVATQRVAWGATAALWVILLLSLPRALPLREGDLGLFFLDVGQGDAALIRTPGGHWIAIDAGPELAGWSAGSKVVAPFLRRMGGRRIDLLVASHAHRDHIGGAAALMESIPIGTVIEPADPFLDLGYVHWLGDISDHQIHWRPGTPGMSWQIDGVKFQVLHPPPEWAHRGEDLNEDSIVLVVTFGDFTALLTGDAGFPAESLFAREAGEIDLLKVGHHGSRWATSDEMLRLSRPQVAVISVGHNNYGHPSPEALSRLSTARVEVLRTDRDGTISVRTDGTTVTVQGARGRRTYSASRTTTRRRRA